MKRIAFIIFSFLLVSINHSTNLYSDITNQLIKLESLYEKGSITKEEFTKAKSIILEMEERGQKTVDKKIKTIKKEKKKKGSLIKTIEIRKFAGNVGQETMEKMEMTIGDFRIYTHRPGGIKIRRISNGEQLATITDNFKVIYYTDAKDIISTDSNKTDKIKPKFTLRIKEIPILRWEGKYVKKHNAYFYQVMALGSKPFHYYIKLMKKGKPVLALNMSKFDRQIEKSVAKAKIEIAAKYKLTVEEIDQMMKQRESQAIKELEDVVRTEEEKYMEANISNIVNDAVSKELADELQKTIGEAMANEFMLALDAEMDNEINQAIADEIASEIDAAISEAIAAGISEATAQAAIAAILDVLARGGTEAEALAACQAIAGDAC